MKFESKTQLFEQEIINRIFHGTLLDNGYNIRNSQIEMVRDIFKLMHSKKEYLVCEAEVGTGKSFAYLIPLLAKQQSKHFGCSIVISTATISLQEQILKDAKFLVELLNLDTDVILSKGANHFLCTKRLNEYFTTNNPPEWTHDWKRKSAYGDKVELSKNNPEINRYWKKINVQGCSFTNCNYYNECPYIQLRAELRKRNKFIVTNHDQLIAHAQKVYTEEYPIFPPDIEYITIDEAHNLEDRAFNALTISFNEKLILDKLRIIDRHLGNNLFYSEILPSLESFETNIREIFNQFTQHFNTEYQKSPYQYDTSRIHLPQIKKQIINQLIDSLNDILNIFNLFERGGRIRENVVNAQRTFEDLLELFQDLKLNRKIFWLEKINNSISVYSVPKEIGDILRETFFSMSGAKFILTSGTITQADEHIFESYMYYLSCIGLDRVSEKSILLAEPKLSPYSYDESTMLYISSESPHPTSNRDAYREWSISELIQLIRLTDGRAMILFTSKDDLKFVHTELNKYDLPWNILVQDSESSQQEVIEEFKNDEQSILLSTGIFWEGIDIQGSSLSNLIIYRLPFPTPDPVLEYKQKQSYSDEEFFLETLVPKMVVRLRQGIGRLIRSESDKGIISILDPRLSSKRKNSYKDSVIDSLRCGPITESFAELKAFAEQLDLVNDSKRIEVPTVIK